MLRKILKPINSPTFKSLYKPMYYNYFNQQQQNFTPEKDYYKILELNKNASESDIKKAYYKLAKQYHPDVNKGYQTKFKEISEAYEVLSNEQVKRQYDSARTFRQGWSKMGSKAQQGSYSYQDMSPQEREQFQRQTNARLRRFGFYLGGFLLFWIFLSRTPHKAYTEYNGTLIPIQPAATFQYPDPYLSQTQVHNPYGGHSPYGQPNNPYAGQPYGNPSYGSGPTQSYGSQYPQGQYLSQYNQYQQQQALGGYPQQQFNYPQAVQQRSQYTIDRPQPHQPYPNSGYAEKPMQTNYQPGFKPQAPRGLED